MATQRALTDRADLFISTAAIAAHATHIDEGFRQRDLRFYVELFSNWVELSFGPYVLEVQNTQLARYLEGLVHSGYAKKVTRKSPPRYRLSRAGFVELIARVVKRSYISQPEHFFFLYYFLKNYRSRLLKLVASEGRPEFSTAVQIEIESYLDTSKLVKNELDEVKKGLERQKRRIEDAKATVTHIQKRKREGVQFDSVVKEIEKRYPYELNSQKPLSELINQIPIDQREWELCDGNTARVNEIWKPGQEILESYERLLRKLV